jgi:glutamate/tyrosine decarboxylase-like PLP-dependent enzyme
VVSIAWTKSHDNAILHHHGWSQCAVLIEEGLFENKVDLGFKNETRVLEPGQTFNTPVGALHQMKCLSTRGRTLHVYTPKIQSEVETKLFFSSSLKTIENDLSLSASVKIEDLKNLLTTIRDQSITTRSPFFMNQLFAGILPQTLQAEEIISQTKTTLATIEASPVFSKIESLVVDALGELIGWEENARDGVSVPGGSAANFMALHCARQKFFPEMKAKGMRGPALKIFVSAEAHYSFKKAAVALGFGTESIVPVPVDETGKMCANQLEILIQETIQTEAIPFFVCATAGTTVLGAFDPIDKIAVICEKYHIWLHVDAAWGGPALFSKKLFPLLSGISLADSVAFDAHKLFGASLTCSFFLTRHRDLLLAANDVSGGDYLFHSEDTEVDRGKLSWQCGRGADSLSFWAIWKNVGTTGLGEFVDRLINIREQATAWIKTEPRLEIVAHPTYLNICLRVQPPLAQAHAKNWSKLVREKLKTQNLAMVNYSSNEEGDFLRLILAHPQLQFDHVKQILQWALEVE